MATYWASQAGGGSGTVLFPFKIADFFALPPAPGDTLRLKTDHYTGASSMISVPATVAGISGAPITVTSDVDGGAEIDGESVRDPMVVPLGADWMAFSGFNCHSSSQASTAVIRIRSNNGVYQRIVAWDAPATFNSHIWDLSGSTNFDTTHPINNLIEDCAGFGQGRKTFSYFQTAGPNTLRRFWGRWEWSVNTGPKEVLPTVYHSGGLTIDNAIMQWDSANMPTSYDVTDGSGNPFLAGSCAGGGNSNATIPYVAGGQCWYFKTGTPTPSGNWTNAYVNEPDGMCADNSASFVPADQRDSNNVMCGILALVTTADQYDCYSGTATSGAAGTNAVFNIYNYGNVTAKDLFVYLAPGVVDSQSLRAPRGLRLDSPALASGSTISGVTSICGGSIADSISSRWAVSDPRGGASVGGTTKVVQGTDLTALGSGSLYAGASGANLGARLMYQYQDGAITTTPLWPWPMSARILAATTLASIDGHGHQIANIDSAVQGVFGAFPVPTPNGVWFV